MKKSKTDQLRDMDVGGKLFFKGANHSTIKSLASRVKALSMNKTMFTVRKTDTGIIVWRLS